LWVPFCGGKSIEVKSISAKPPIINNTKFSQCLLPKIINATQAFPVIIEPVARRPDLKSGLEKKNAMKISLKSTC